MAVPTRFSFDFEVSQPTRILVVLEPFTVSVWPFLHDLFLADCEDMARFEFILILILIYCGSILVDSDSVLIYVNYF